MRDVGWVFWSVAMHEARKRSKRDGVRYRVRAGRDGGWVAEPAYFVKERFYPSAEEWIAAYSKPPGGLSGGSCRA